MSIINIVKIIVDNKSELKEKMRKSKTPNLIVGEDSQIENSFYIFKGEINNGTSDIFEIGVISEGHGLQPECKLIDESYVLLGMNKEIHIVDIKDFSRHYKFVFDSLFYEFVSCKLKDRIIALYELGVICVSLDGVKLWNHSTEIICDYKVMNNTIELITDEFITTISVSNGELINKRAKSI